MHKIFQPHLLRLTLNASQLKLQKLHLNVKLVSSLSFRLNDVGERIPLTIADSDSEKGTIDIIVQGIGKTTKELNTLESGDYIVDVVGPLGKASHIENFGTAVSIGGGVGTAIAYPTAVALSRLAITQFQLLVEGPKSL